MFRKVLPFMVALAFTGVAHASPPALGPVSEANLDDSGNPVSGPLPYPTQNPGVPPYVPPPPDPSPPSSGGDSGGGSDGGGSSAPAPAPATYTPPRCDSWDSCSGPEEDDSTGGTVTEMPVPNDVMLEAQAIEGQSSTMIYGQVYQLSDGRWIGLDEQGNGHELAPGVVASFADYRNQVVTITGRPARADTPTYPIYVDSITTGDARQVAASNPAARCWQIHGKYVHHGGIRYFSGRWFHHYDPEWCMTRGGVVLTVGGNNYVDVELFYSYDGLQIITSGTKLDGHGRPIGKVSVSAIAQIHLVADGLPGPLNKTDHIDVVLCQGGRTDADC